MAWVFSYKFAAYFQNIFSWEPHCRAASETRLLCGNPMKLQNKKIVIQTLRHTENLKFFRKEYENMSFWLLKSVCFWHTRHTTWLLKYHFSLVLFWKKHVKVRRKVWKNLENMTDAHSEPCQTSEMEYFTKIATGF